MNDFFKRFLACLLCIAAVAVHHERVQAYVITNVSSNPDDKVSVLLFKTEYDAIKFREDIAWTVKVETTTDTTFFFGLLGVAATRTTEASIKAQRLVKEYDNIIPEVGVKQAIDDLRGDYNQEKDDARQKIADEFAMLIDKAREEYTKKMAEISAAKKNELDKAVKEAQKPCTNARSKRDSLMAKAQSTSEKNEIAQKYSSIISMKCGNAVSETKRVEREIGIKYSMMENVPKNELAKKSEQLREQRNNNITIQLHDLDEECVKKQIELTSKSKVEWRWDDISEHGHFFIIYTKKPVARSGGISGIISGAFAKTRLGDKYVNGFTPSVTGIVNRAARFEYHGGTSLTDCVRQLYPFVKKADAATEKLPEDKISWKTLSDGKADSSLVIYEKMTKRNLAQLEADTAIPSQVAIERNDQLEVQEDEYVIVG